AKLTADDRRHGLARGFVFSNSTIAPDDIQLVEDPIGWVELPFKTYDAGDGTIPDKIIGYLNGAPLDDGWVLTWAQVCSARILFPNRQEGNSDGATFTLFYPKVA